MFNQIKNIVKGVVKLENTSYVLRSEADNQRDNENWAQAAVSYGKYLDLNPDDFGIWVQRGNSLKEAGDYDSALQAYQKAITLNPADSDVNLQFGHLHKLRKDKTSAIAAYQRALEYDSGSAAFGELVTLGIQPIAGTSADEMIISAGPVVYFDITDILIFLDVNSNVSGIQRVITKISSALFLDGNLLGYKHRFCSLESDLIREVPKGLLRQLFDLIKTPGVSRNALNIAVAACRGHREADIVRGDIFIILGAFWISPSYPIVLREFRERGVLISVYVYDLIPINSKQFVSAGTAVEFSERILGIIAQCDFVLTISQFVAGEVKKLIQSELKRDIPVQAVTLAQELDFVPGRSNIGREILASTREKYVLCVGTLEIRKNHIYLFKIWRDLITSRGEDVPNLVLVGRWGWKIDELRDELEESDYLENKIIVLSSVADSELTYLYKHCLFTVFPSTVEGWGLPIGESLAYGKLCIASNTTSMPEVGGDFVRYIDPFDLSDGKAQITWALDHPKEVDAWTDRIKREFKPRTWTNVAADMGQAIRALSAVADPNRDTDFTLPSGEVVEVGENHIRHRAKDELRWYTLPLIFFSGWSGSEDWGRWSTNRVARMRFRVDGVHNETLLRLALRLQLPLSQTAVALTVRSRDQMTNFVISDSNRRWYYCQVRANADGCVEVSLAVKGTVMLPEGELRSLYIGVSAIGIAEQGEVEQRLRLLEGVTTCR